MKEVPRYQLQLESELERAITNLRTELINSEDYGKSLTSVERLHKMMDKERPSTVSKDTMLAVAANLIGIILIIKHEHVNVITSRALNFVMRPR